MSGGDIDPIIVAGDDGVILDESEDEQRCRNGTPNCAGPAAFDLSSEFHVPICQQCVREATCPSGNCGP